MIAGLLKTHHCNELTKENLDQTVELAGWVQKSRDLGGLHFKDIRDKYGITQLNFSEYKGDFKDVKEVGLESTIWVKGVVKNRPSEALNKNMNTGEIEVLVHEFQVLSFSDKDNLPFLPTGKVEATEDLKLKYRYLALRNSRLQKIIKLRSDLSLKIRSSLVKEGFVEVETPILYKSTPEGARDYIVPSRVHKGKVYALPQSPQTLKQLLMIGGTDKYFQIVKCFRDEDLRADRQPEFTQVDIEVSFATEEYIKNLTEYLLKEMFGLNDSFKLEVMSYQTAMEDYGCDKPDLRFGLKHFNVTNVFEDSSFKIFNEAQKNGGLIKAMFVSSNDGDLPRKEIDKLTEVIKPVGGKGVAWFKVKNGELSGGISKFIDEKLLKEFQQISNNEDGLFLFCSDIDHKVAHQCADVVRRHLGKQLNLIGSENKFLWVNNFPLLEFDEDTNRCVALHHPFTKCHPEDEPLYFSDKKEDWLKVRASAYDLVCNGYEIAGGSVRIHDNGMQERMFELLGMSVEEREHQFGFFLEALKYGVPPHAGIAFGLDRNIMILAGTDNIRDVIAFPKTANATDLMSSSPSTPAKEQTDELHFSFHQS